MIMSNTTKMIMTTTTTETIIGIVSPPPFVGPTQIKIFSWVAILIMVPIKCNKRGRLLYPLTGKYFWVQQLTMFKWSQQLYT